VSGACSCSPRKFIPISLPGWKWKALNLSLYPFRSCHSNPAPNKAPPAPCCCIPSILLPISLQHHPLAPTLCCTCSSHPKQIHTFYTTLTFEYHRKHVFQASCPRGRCWLCCCPASCQHAHLRLLHHRSVDEQHRRKPEDIIDSRCQHCRHWQL
jgi:hypothetical protein